MVGIEKSLDAGGIRKRIILTAGVGVEAAGLRVLPHLMMVRRRKVPTRMMKASLMIANRRLPLSATNILATAREKILIRVMTRRKRLARRRQTVLRGLLARRRQTVLRGLLSLSPRRISPRKISEERQRTNKPVLGYCWNAMYCTILLILVRMKVCLSCIFMSDYLHVEFESASKSATLYWTCYCDEIDCLLIASVYWCTLVSVEYIHT